jgi:hypothetical protein
MKGEQSKRQIGPSADGYRVAGTRKGCGLCGCRPTNANRLVARAYGYVLIVVTANKLARTAGRSLLPRTHVRALSVAPNFGSMASSGLRGKGGFEVSREQKLYRGLI